MERKESLLLHVKESLLPLIRFVRLAEVREALNRTVPLMTFPPDLLLFMRIPILYSPPLPLQKVTLHGQAGPACLSNSGKVTSRVSSIKRSDCNLSARHTDDTLSATEHEASNEAYVRHYINSFFTSLSLLHQFLTKT